MRTFAQKPKATNQTTSVKSKKTSRPFWGQSRNVHSFFDLQRTIGNQAILRLLQTAKENVDARSTNTATTGFAHDFSQIPVQATAFISIQPKLKVNAPGDQYEQEAERVADQVMRQKMPEEEDEKVEIQATASLQAAGGEREVNEELKNRLSRSKSGGNPISDQVRAFVEPRMQFDFSKVHVHTDNEAARMNQELGSRAFTHGRDIYFGVGQYNPQSIEGNRLLAHELTHVLQQTEPVSQFTGARVQLSPIARAMRPCERYQQQLWEARRELERVEGLISTYESQLRRAQESLRQCGEESTVVIHTRQGFRRFPCNQYYQDSIAQSRRELRRLHSRRDELMRVRIPQLRVLVARECGYS